MAKSDWHVGQQVLIVDNWGGNNRPTVLLDAEVAKVGRAWLTVKSGAWREDRYDFEGRAERDIGWSSRLYTSRQVYEAEAARRAAWSALHSAVRQQNHPPAGMALETIQQAHALLFPRRDDQP